MSLNPQNYICVRGAREHNLKNLSVDIPKNQLVVITGLSGSGKSSLAFDTIYAEGQRRYVESLSAYARQFLQLMQKPQVDMIEGLSPAISIEQKTTSKNPRSTVGTITEIYDYMRVLFARIGVPYSPATGKPITSQTISQMVDLIQTLPMGTKFYILSPIVRGRKGEYKQEIKELQKQGFQRLRVDGTIYEIDHVPALNKKVKHDIAVVIDRLITKEGLESRLVEALETALPLSGGLVICQEMATDIEHLYSENFSCPVSGFSLEELEPRLFSFNSPFGACPTCDGLGISLHFDKALIVPHPTKNIFQGAVAPWSGAFADYYIQAMATTIRYFDADPNLPFSDLPQSVQEVLWYGSGKKSLPLSYKGKKRTYRFHKPFEGILPNLERRWRETDSEKAREHLSSFQSKKPCDACDGYRLKPEALAVKIHHQHIGEISALSVEDAKRWFDELPQHLSAQNQTIAKGLLKEIGERLHFLTSVGLGYLSLSRLSGTLSGGESQRIRLASQIGSGLTGVLYVLDEPSIGLHQRDNMRLLQTLERLRDLGNSVIVVEHDEDAIRRADHVIDMGPRAGTQGGHIVAQGTPQDIIASPHSLTGAYLRGEKWISRARHKLPPNTAQKFLTLEGVTTNNLQNVSVKFPLGKFVAITGVSGSGKSSLILSTLYPALKDHLAKEPSPIATYKSLSGTENVDKIIDIDQSPIGRTPRSNPATYTGLFTPIREWFARLPEARARGYTPGRFSFNVKGGRCETCKGDGVLKIEMHFLPDVYVTCDQCKGRRYNRETLQIKHKGKSIADILEMSVDEGTNFFAAIPSIYNKLNLLQKVGLGYIHIGQQAPTLSGGEAQRIKLAKELARASTGKTVYILDEPTTGLHFEDINNLLKVLHALVEQGNSVFIIEHNLDVIKTADWIIDLGPDGGKGGGRIIAEGRPVDIAQIKESPTGVFLAPHISPIPTQAQ